MVPKRVACTDTCVLSYPPDTLTSRSALTSRTTALCSWHRVSKRWRCVLRRVAHPSPTPHPPRSSHTRTQCRSSPQTLIINGCVNVTADGVVKVIENNKRIQELRVAHVRTVDDNVLFTCAQHLWLEHLDVSHCTMVTDAGLKALAGSCLGLAELRVEWCRRVSTEGVKTVIRECKLLAELDIRNCDNVSVPHLRGVMEGRESLKVTQTEELPPDVLEKVAAGETTMNTPPRRRDR